MYKCSVCHDSKKMAGIGYMIVDCEFCLRDEVAMTVIDASETSESDISVKTSNKRSKAYKEAVKELMTSLSMSKAEAEALLDKS